MYEKVAWQTFNEELELYELLDLDAKSEKDANVDVDDSTSKLLTD